MPLDPTELTLGGHGAAAIEAAPPLRSVSCFASGKTDETHACVTSDVSHPPTGIARAVRAIWLIDW